MVSRNTIYQRRRYQGRKKKGLCVKCGAKVEPGKTMCDFHSEQNRENSRKNHQEKKDKEQLYTDEEWMADEE